MNQTVLADADIVALYFSRDERALAATQQQYAAYLTAIALNLLAAANCIYCYFRDKRGIKNMIGSYVLMALVVVISLLTWEGWYSVAIMVGLVFNTISLALDHPQKTRGMMLIKAPLCFVYNLMVGSLGGMIYECAILSSAVIGLFRYRGKHIEKKQGGTQ